MKLVSSVQFTIIQDVYFWSDLKEFYIQVFHEDDLE